MKNLFKIYLLALLLVFVQFGFTQDQKQLTLQQVIELAKEQSLDAFISKNLYLVSFWEFRSYQAERRPWLAFNPSPMSYKNSVSTYQDSTGSIRYIRENSFSTFGALSLSQNIALTGGNVSTYTGLDRIENFKAEGNTLSFNSTPVSIGINQPLFQYNDYRWQKKVEPLKFEKAKKEYIESVENISRQAIYYFFNLLDARQASSIALLNKSTADTIYQKSLGRYERGAIALKDLQRLELNLLNSNLEYEKVQLQLERIKFDLVSFLRLPETTEVSLVFPDEFPKVKIQPAFALGKAMENNPDILDFRQRMIESDRKIASAKGSTGIQSNLSMNLGWGKSDDKLNDIYNDLNSNRSIKLGLYIPIVDWGLSKGKREMAKSNKEVVMARVEKERIEFQQDVLMSAVEFNLLESQLESVVKAREIAERSYKTISDRFLLGKENIETLYASRNERDSAFRAYYKKLREIWVYYYYMRGVTLYDFEKEQDLSQDFNDFFGLNNSD